MVQPKFSALILICLLGLLVACRSEEITPSPELDPQPTNSPTVKPTSLPPPTLPPTPTVQEKIDPTQTADQTEATPFNTFDSPAYGVQAFLWWRPDIAVRDLNLVNELDFQWVKQAFAWRDIETLEKGKYDWWRPDIIVDAVEEAGLNLIVRIDRQPFWTQEPGTDPLENAPPTRLEDFSDFCGALAERYRGRIAVYQIWNEPNLNREWGDRPPDPAEYTNLLKACYQAIKAADSEALVISAGLAPTGTGLPNAIPDTEFLQGMYDAGAADYFDVLGLNAPGYKAPPETSPEEGESNPEYGGGRWFVFRHVEDMREIMVANGDADKQVAILELGWTTDQINPTYAWHAVSEEQRADYLVRAYQYAAENWSPWIGPMVAIYIADYDWTAEENEQWWWAITLPDGSLRPAFTALKEMDK